MSLAASLGYTSAPPMPSAETVPSSYGSVQMKPPGAAVLSGSVSRVASLTGLEAPVAHNVNHTTHQSGGHGVHVSGSFVERPPHFGLLFLSFAPPPPPPPTPPPLWLLLFSTPTHLPHPLFVSSTVHSPVSLTNILCLLLLLSNTLFFSSSPLRPFSFSPLLLPLLIRPFVAPSPPPLLLWSLSLPHLPLSSVAPPPPPPPSLLYCSLSSTAAPPLPLLSYPL